MNLDELKARGGIVSAVLVPAEVQWTHADPETGDEITDVFTVHVKRQSFGSIERLFAGSDDRSKSAAFIAECIRLGEGGSETMRYEDAYQLDPGLAAELLKAVNAANGTGRAEPKNSAPPMSSGTTSSLPASAAEQ